MVSGSRALLLRVDDEKHVRNNSSGRVKNKTVACVSAAALVSFL